MQKKAKGKAVVTWGCSIGRVYLYVNGVVVAVEGERCYDANLVEQHKSITWTSDMIKKLCDEMTTLKEAQQE